MELTFEIDHVDMPICVVNRLEMEVLSPLRKSCATVAFPEKHSCEIHSLVLRSSLLLVISKGSDMLESSMPHRFFKRILNSRGEVFLSLDMSSPLLEDKSPIILKVAIVIFPHDLSHGRPKPSFKDLECGLGFIRSLLLARICFSVDLGFVCDHLLRLLSLHLLMIQGGSRFRYPRLHGKVLESCLHLIEFIPPPVGNETVENGFYVFHVFDRVSPLSKGTSRFGVEPSGKVVRENMLALFFQRSLKVRILSLLSLQAVHFKTEICI